MGDDRKQDADTVRNFSVRVYAEQSHEVIVQARSREEAEALMWDRIGENGEDVDDLGEPRTWGVNIVVVPCAEAATQRREG